MKSYLKLFHVLQLVLLGAVYSSFALGANSDPKIARQFLYAISNSASGNSVVGYKIGNAGNLDPLPGSPFSTFGLGQGVTILVSSDSGLVASEDNRFLFVPNRGSNDIAVFRIRPDGTLASVSGSPFPSGGITPTSLAISGDTLFVAHSGLGLFLNCTDCDYRGFRVSESGRLTPIEGSYVKLSESPPSGPLAIRFSPDGKFLFGTELVSGKINVYKFNHDAEPGKAVLTPAPGSPFMANDKLPLGFNFNPNNPTQLFVSNVGLTANSGSVSPYLIANSGQISPIGEAVTSGQTATCWINLTHDGKWLFATNPPSDTVSSFGVAADGRLSLVDTTALPNDSIQTNKSLAAVDMAMTSGDEYLYVLTRIVPAITGFKIGTDGKLAPISSVKFNIPDAVPFGLVHVDLGKSKARQESHEKEKD